MIRPLGKDKAANFCVNDRANIAGGEDDNLMIVEGRWPQSRTTALLSHSAIKAMHGMIYRGWSLISIPVIGSAC